VLVAVEVEVVLAVARVVDLGVQDQLLKHHGYQQLDMGKMLVVPIIWLVEEAEHQRLLVQAQVALEVVVQDIVHLMVAVAVSPEL
jgi:hypothetical protein